MLNDIIDIMDAKIINFSVNFSVQVDKRFDNTEVLSQCIKTIKNYFSDVLYVGEPIYLTRIYQILNDVEGVVDAKSVTLENKTGGRYSQTTMDFRDALSKDGTYIKIPKNVIAELKYPNLDIKGTAK